MLQSILSICIFTYRGNPKSGGQGVYVRNLSQALVDAGHKVTIVSGQPYPHPPKGVELVQLPTLNLAEAPSKLLAFKWRYLFNSVDRFEYFASLTGLFPDPEAFGRRFDAWLQSSNRSFDIIHDNQTISYASLDIQKRHPLMTIIHHPITKDLTLALQATKSISLRFLIRRWYQFLRMQKTVAPQLHHVIVPSKSSGEDIVTDFGVQKQGIRQVPLGVDRSSFKPLPGIQRQPHRLICTVSADAPLKGMIYLLQAMNILRKKIPDIKLTLIGEPKPNSESAKYIKANGLEPYVECSGYVTEQRLVELYAQATVAIVPSLYEGFCIPAIEAMACDVPLVATTAGAISETAQGAALFCEPRQAQAIADHVETLLADEALRNQLVKQGQQLIEQRYNWPAVAKLMTSLYVECIEDFKGNPTQKAA